MTNKANVSLIASLMELIGMVEDLTGIEDKHALRCVTDCLLREFTDVLSVDEGWQAVLQEKAIKYQKGARNETK